MFVKYLDKYQERVFHEKDEKNTCCQAVYLGTALTFACLNPSAFLSVGRLKAVVYSDAIGTEEIIHQRVLMPVRTFATAPEPTKLCDSPRSDVSVCALIVVEDILSIPCEL
jgi:hypothetical protein